MSLDLYVWLPGQAESGWLDAYYPLYEPFRLDGRDLSAGVEGFNDALGFAPNRTFLAVSDDSILPREDPETGPGCEAAARQARERAGELTHGVIVYTNITWQDGHKRINETNHFAHHLAAMGGGVVYDPQVDELLDPGEEPLNDPTSLRALIGTLARANVARWRERLGWASNR